MALLILVVIVILLAAPAADAAGWRRPVDGTVLRAFAVGADRFARGQHRGVDLGAPVGARVRAACGGRVSFIGRVPGGGLTVSVRCGRLVATYQHLGAAGVRRGQVLRPGTMLGAVGRSGAPRSHRPHLHLGAREAASGRYVDPMSLVGGPPPPLPSLLPGRPPARLLPLGPGAAPARVPWARPLPLGPGAAPARVPWARPLPLGPGAAPARVPWAQPLPLGPAPAPRTSQPSAIRLSGRVAAPTAPQRGDDLPPTVWAGLACVALGLPLGGFITVRRRRRRAVAHAPQAA